VSYETDQSNDKNRGLTILVAGPTILAALSLHFR